MTPPTEPFPPGTYVYNRNARQGTMWLVIAPKKGQPEWNRRIRLVYYEPQKTLNRANKPVPLTDVALPRDLEEVPPLVVLAAMAP